MARIKNDKSVAARGDPPALTPEDREDQLISLAVDLAEQRLRDGTASNQLIAEIMKLGTTKERLQKEKLQRENEMLRAKTKVLQAQEQSNQMYAQVLDAIRSYGGFNRSDNDYEEIE